MNKFDFSSKSGGITVNNSSAILAKQKKWGACSGSSGSSNSRSMASKHTERERERLKANASKCRQVHTH